MFEEKNKVYTSEAEYLHEEQQPQKRRMLTNSEVRWLIVAVAFILLAVLAFLAFKRFADEAFLHF